MAERLGSNPNIIVSGNNLDLALLLGGRLPNFLSDRK